MIKYVFYYILISIGVAYGQPASEGLQPFRPPAGTKVSDKLRLEPNDDAVLLREIKPTDKLSVLRSNDNWYEIDVTTPEGLTFRGWVKGVIAAERLPPPPPPPAPMTEPKPSPFESSKYLWFWSDQIKEKGSLVLQLGMQDLTYSLNGIQSGTRSSVYKSDFLGIAIGARASFTLLETRLFDDPFFVVLEGSYHYALSRLSFSAGFEVPEVAGKGYEITVNTYSGDLMAKYRFIQQPSFSLQAGLGVGYYYHEIAPDLEPIQGGTYNGKLIFVQTSFGGFILPFVIEGTAWENFSFGVRISPIFFADLSESGLQTPKLKSSGLPMVVSANLGYRLNKYFSMEVEGEQLKISGTSTGTGERLNKTYTDAHLSTTYQRAYLGFRFHF